MLPVSIFPQYAPSSHPSPLYCAVGKWLLPAMRCCWLVGWWVRPKTHRDRMESSQGSPTLPLPYYGRHQAEGSCRWECNTETSRFEEWRKGMGKWLHTGASPFLLNCGEQCIMQLQSPICAVPLPHWGQRSEAVAVQEALGFDCKHLLSEEGYLWTRKHHLHLPRGDTSYCRFKTFLISCSAIISIQIYQSTNTQCTVEKLSKRYFLFHIS